MGLDDIPLFAMLKGKLGYINRRQTLISQNVANADTPGYAPRDLKAFNFAAMTKAATLGVSGPTRTNAAHMSGTIVPSTPGAKDAATPDSEVRIDGNQVVLEEQMMKLTQSRLDYEAAIDFYQQSMNMITTAARAPGKAA